MKDRSLCPEFESAFAMLGKKWNGLIIRVLLSGSKRFNKIADEIPQMSDRMLAERLKQLEEDEIVVRHVYPETPVRIDYELTDKGKALEEVMDTVQDWAVTWIQQEKKDL